MSNASFRSVPDMFLHRVAATPDKPAFMQPTATGWQTFSWKQTEEKVRHVAAGLRALGLKDEQRCAILCSTRLEWILADLGILCAAGATTTIYPSSTADECAFILKDSNSSFVFAESDDHVMKLASKRAELPEVQKVITMDGHAGQDGWVITMAELMDLGRQHDARNPDEFPRITRSIQPQSLATLIYTSGTTGRPKGVELTHDCWMYEGEAVHDIQLVREDDLQYLWLPLSHSFGKVIGAAQLRIGFTTAVDGRIDKMVENLGVIRPTFVCGVPRIFEKIHNKVVAMAREGGTIKWNIFQWALDIGRQVSALQQKGLKPTGLLAAQHAVADKLVLSKIRARFGGRLRHFISGSAPLSRYLAEFFHAAGVLILEGYGLTESSAGTVVNRPHNYRLGTVGLPMPGTQVKIAEDGEILLKGRGVMRGYHGMPDVTGETLVDGWLHTGDIGMVDRDGFLIITDRKKDLIKTSGGKYVAPQALEGRFKVICPYISQIVVHGDNRNFCSALITVEEESVRKWARENGLSLSTYADLAGSEQVRTLIQGYVDKLNKELPSYETIKKFVLLPADLTEAAGELTASLKVKRKAVEKKYKHLLDTLYDGSVHEVRSTSANAGEPV